MKALLAAILLTVAGCVALAGCGSSAKAGPRSFTGPVTTTLADVKTGDTLSCTSSKGMHIGASVPPAGHGVTGNGDGPSGGATIQLTRRGDGSLVVSCRP